MEAQETAHGVVMAATEVLRKDAYKVSIRVEVLESRAVYHGRRVSDRSYEQISGRIESIDTIEGQGPFAAINKSEHKVDTEVLGIDATESARPG